MRTCTIDGVTVNTILGGAWMGDGKYAVHIPRDGAELYDVERIHWDHPDIRYPADFDDLRLPEGCGFNVDRIQYDSLSREYVVSLSVQSQFFGDTEPFQRQINELSDAIEAIAAAYSEGVEANG